MEGRGMAAVVVGNKVLQRYAITNALKRRNIKGTWAAWQTISRDIERGLGVLERYTGSGRNGTCGEREGTVGVWGLLGIWACVGGEGRGGSGGTLRQAEQRRSSMRLSKSEYNRSI